jgi:hypothetical protein
LLADQLRVDLDEVEEDIIDWLERQAVRCYHGCRTDDAGTYFRQGLRVHRREEQEAAVRQLVESDARLRWMLPGLADTFAKFPSTTDEHRCFVVLDDRALLDRAAHYLIYGSEWICAVLGRGSRGPLLERGVPTMIEVDLPLMWTSFGQREALASLLLREWTRQVAQRPRQVLVVDFTFTMHHDLPPEVVTGHYHPTEMEDPLEGSSLYRPPGDSCLHCRADVG